MMNRLLVDTDGGTDDALAFAMLAANGASPAFITTVFGNVSLVQATANILATIAVLGIDAPVHAGADRPLIGAAIDAADVHGEDGLGGAPRPAVVPALASFAGIGFLIATLGEAAASNRPIDILALGPLTNLALALRTDPSIIAGIGKLVIMGGTVRGRGNVTGAAEFNILADPEAAAIVLSAPIGTVLVPWEPCVDALIEGAVLDDLFAEAPLDARSKFLKALVDQLRRASLSYGEGDRLSPADPLAAAILIDPTIATGTIEAGVAVECAGLYGRGATIHDLQNRWKLPVISTVETVDAARFAALFFDSVRTLRS